MIDKITDSFDNRIILPATTQGEVVIASPQDFQKKIRQLIEKKQSRQKMISTIENLLAVLLVVFWVVGLIYIKPFISGIRDYSD